MTYQHREFQSWLRDAERLWLYAQSAVFDHRALSASLDETESRSRCWEKEAKEGIKKVAQAEAERDAARHKASMARMDADAARSTKTQVESELLGSKMPWRFQRKLGGRRKMRLAVWPSSQSLCF